MDKKVWEQRISNLLGREEITNEERTTILVSFLEFVRESAPNKCYIVMGEQHILTGKERYKTTVHSAQLSGATCSKRCNSSISKKKKKLKGPQCQKEIKDEEYRLTEKRIDNGST